MDPFTNEPYAFDDQGSSADPREADFNNGIREITVRKIPEIASLQSEFFISLCKNNSKY